MRYFYTCPNKRRVIVDEFYSSSLTKEFHFEIVDNMKYKGGLYAACIQPFTSII